MAQPVRVPTGQPYGKAKEMADAQRSAPLPSASAAPGQASAPGGGGTSWEAAVTPLDAPSQRPGEHVMDGVDVGPGRTGAQAGVPGAMGNATRDGILNTLRGIYEAFPLDGIKNLISGFADNDPWTINDLFLPSPGDMWEETKAWANKVPHPKAMRPGLLPGGGQPPAPFGDPNQDPMFDPNMPLDPSQVQDKRAEGATLRAALGGAAISPGIEANLGTGNEADVLGPGTAPPDLTAGGNQITRRTGAQ